MELPPLQEFSFPLKLHLVGYPITSSFSLDAANYYIKSEQNILEPNHIQFTNTKQSNMWALDS